MAKRKEEVIREMSAYLRDRGNFSYWFVSIASDPRTRLFTHHQVTETRGRGWIYRECETSDDARAVADYLIMSLGTDGAGSDDDTARYVYAYRKTSATRQTFPQ